ncbi:MAG TPA: hypothetical protein VGN31_20800 [Paraburkholderia sp.]
MTYAPSAHNRLIIREVGRTPRELRVSTKDLGKARDTLRSFLDFSAFRFYILGCVAIEYIDIADRVEKIQFRFKALLFVRKSFPLFYFL